VLLYAVPVILGVWAIVDCAQTAAADVRRMPRSLWVLVIAFIPVLGPLAWLTLGRRRGSKPIAPAPPARPLAPDDDPDFLRGIDQARRQAERAEKAKRAQQPPSPPRPEPKRDSRDENELLEGEPDEDRA